MKKPDKQLPENQSSLPTIIWRFFKSWYW